MRFFSKLWNFTVFHIRFRKYNEKNMWIRNIVLAYFISNNVWTLFYRSKNWWSWKRVLVGIRYCRYRILLFSLWRQRFIPCHVNLYWDCNYRTPLIKSYLLIVEILQRAILIVINGLCLVSLSRALAIEVHYC